MNETKNNKLSLNIKVMKILREKIFFDYKGYASKFGKDAAAGMKRARNTAARMIRSDRRSAQSSLAFAKGVTSNPDLISKTKGEGKKAVAGTLSNMKSWLSDIQSNHAKGVL